MRFLLLARDRSSGRVRLLSERAFDSRAAAVDAASDTVSATGLDLTVDEVLAVDLEAADPVLVLRIAAVAGPAAVRDVDEARAAAHEAITSLIAPPPAPPEIPRPWFPLFGLPAEETPGDEALADTLGQVARLMEADLAEWALEEPDRSGEDWDARMLDDYSLPDDGALQATREEGRTRIDSAETSRCGDHAEVRDEIPVSDNDPFTDAYVEAPAWTDDTAGEAAGEVEIPADPGNRAVDWERPSGFYRPATADFAVWVCADCVYQRTCRKAGTARPSTCGNFQWRA